jgi:hypothetical protein
MKIISCDQMKRRLLSLLRKPHAMNTESLVQLREEVSIAIE